MGTSDDRHPHMGTSDERLPAEAWAGSPGPEPLSLWRAREQAQTQRGKKHGTPTACANQSSQFTATFHGNVSIESSLSMGGYVYSL